MGISTVILFLEVGCSDEGKRRSETSFNFQSMKPLLLENLPENFRELTSDSSQKICSAEGCPSRAQIISQYLWGTDTTGINEFLTRVDQKTLDLSNQLNEHYVPCLEKNGLFVTHNLTQGEVEQSVQSTINCYLSYNTGEGYSQMTHQFSFGQGESESFYVIDSGSIGGQVINSFWLSQDSNKVFDLWYASNTPSYTGGSLTGILSHLRSHSSENTVEFTSAGVGSLTQENPFICGVQIKLNSQYLYLKGKIPDFSGGCSAVEQSCENIAVAELCYKIDDFSTSTGNANCESLKTFSLAQILPDQIDPNTWRSSININLASKVPRFVLNGLEIQEW